MYFININFTSECLSFDVGQFETQTEFDIPRMNLVFKAEKFL